MRSLTPVAAILVVVVMALSACRTEAAAPNSATANPLNPQGFADVVADVAPSIVTVQAEYDGGISSGSGIVLRPDVIVTNAHVVGTARNVEIIFADSTRSQGRVRGTDKATDVAVVESDRDELPVPEYRSDLPRPGEIALVLGNPLGEFPNSVTAGIISGLHRSGLPGAVELGVPDLVDLIQTDAAVSHGNSGGALVDVTGKVVGMNAAGRAEEERNAEGEVLFPAGESLGFAIPTATVLDVAEQLLTDGKASHPYLGVTPETLTPAVAQMRGVDAERGALVRSVDRGSPAAEAGVRPGDVIVEFAGKTVESADHLLAALRQTEPDSEQSLGLVRGDDRQDLSITVGSR